MPRMTARRAYLVLSAAHAVLWAVAFTLGVVYQVQVARLDPLQLVLVGTVLEATCFLGEIPTGLVADLVSRRLSVVVGYALIGLGVLVIGAFPAFVPILVGNVVWGLGFTFTSGATDAWLADEVGEEAVQPIFTRGQQLALAGTFVGTALAGALGVVALRLPILVGGGGLVALAALLAVVMPERGFTPSAPHGTSSWRHLGATVRHGLAHTRTPGVVRTFMVVALVTGLTSEVFDRLWTDRVLTDFHLPTVLGVSSPAAWFAAFAMVSSLISLLASTAANRYAAAALASAHPVRPMVLLLGVQAVAVLGFALAPWLWGAMACQWARLAAMAVASPVRRAWLNRHIDPAARATTLSMMSQADAIGQVVGGPAFGALARSTSVVLALAVSAVVQLPALPMVARLHPDRGRETAR